MVFKLRYANKVSAKYMLIAEKHYRDMLEYDPLCKIEMHQTGISIVFNIELVKYTAHLHIYGRIFSILEPKGYGTVKELIQRIQEVRL